MLTRLKSPTRIMLLVAAAVLALGGTATAAKLITGKQVKNNSLTGKDIRNGSVAAQDLKADAKAALTGPTGPAGAPGAKGDTGAAGLAGPPSGFMGRSNSLSIGTIDYEFGYLNGAGSAVSDAGDRTMLSPGVALKATRIAVKLTAPPGGTSTRAVRLRVNGENTDLFCVVSAAEPGCTGTASVDIPADAEVSVQHLSGLTAPAAADAIYSVTVERA